MSPDQKASDSGESPLLKKTLDKDLSRIGAVTKATQSTARRLISVGLGVFFLAVVGVFASVQIGATPNALFIIVAVVLGGYMALNIGANDVANNVAPAVGSKALTLLGALAIAAVFETAGALIAGGDVVATISKGIIDPELVGDSETFVWVMMAALLSAALWLNLATYLGAPVSTTHAIVGGVAGAGIAAVGINAVNWATMAKIAASWVISPLLGGIIAALFLSFIKINVIYRDDKVAAAKRWVPLLLAIMATAFSCYLMIKGFKKIWRPEPWMVAAFGAAAFAVSLALLRPWVARQARGMENRNQSLRILFHVPLICSAALLSFAHGANDVANAVGPLAAIFHSAASGEIASKVEIPVWIMLIGAGGIALGLFLFGPNLIRIVGEQITSMNPIRAFCVALSAAITVIVASALGLPISTTHTTVGAIFGVGFFREYFTRHSSRRRDYLRNKGSLEQKADSKAKSAKMRPRKLVRRTHFLSIVSAWIITVPAAAGLSAALYLASAVMR